MKKDNLRKSAAVVIGIMLTFSSAACIFRGIQYINSGLIFYGSIIGGIGVVLGTILAAFLLVLFILNFGMKD